MRRPSGTDPGRQERRHTGVDAVPDLSRGAVVLGHLRVRLPPAVARAVRVDGGELVVNVDKMFKSDADPAGWAAATVKV